MLKKSYLEIGTGQQKKILTRIKKNSELTWNEIAKIIQVNKRMIFFYLNEQNRLLLKKLILLLDKTNTDKNILKNLKLIKMNDFGIKKIIKPKLNENLSEFLGALSGDGNIDKKNHRISVTCDQKSDFDYVNKIIKNAFSNLFGVETTIIIQKRTIRCQTYSKELANYLESLGFTKGNRKNKTKIPKNIFENKKYLAAFLRGVFDTDGSFHRKRERSAVVEYISCSQNFLLQIKEGLKKLGLKATSYGKSVYIYDQSQVDNFFKLIKPKNLKHNTKYNIFKKVGKVSLHKEYLKMN